MKNIFSIFLFCSISLSVVARETIHFVTAIIPPYQKYSTEKKLVGTGIDALNCALKNLDVETRIQVHSWKRAQFLVRQGQADGFFVASRNSNRDQFATFSAPMLESKWLWVSKVGKYKVLSKEVSKVGTIVGTNMAHFQSKNFKNVILSKDIDRLILLIQKDRVDRIMCTPDMFNEALMRLKLKHNDFEVEVAKDRPLGVYFGKHFIERHPRFLKKFNNAVLTCSRLN